MRCRFLFELIHSFIESKNFSAALEILMNKYPYDQSTQSSILADHIGILSFWKNYEYRYPDSATEIYNIWLEFDAFIIQNNLFYSSNIIEMIALTVMSDIYRLLLKENITPISQSSFASKILYAKSLLWTKQTTKSFQFLSELLRYYPSESEIWALFGKIYAPLNIKKSRFFYREAFFINPSVLNLIDIHSVLIDEAILFYQKEEPMEKKKILFLNWLAIYGIIGNIFNTQYSISPQENEIMEKRIRAYENRYQKVSIHEEYDTVNLLRLFVFEYDYCLFSGNMSQSDKILEKILNLSPQIYKKFERRMF